ncbi:hypothetical protein Cmtc_18880 [Cupriavidus sp. TKC]|uniref:STY1053 family phage-associated protein n=1 Tax=Cupriavidus sp. TKC TaxID=2880159 RepID=UPI0025A90CE0|nr:hypothetical protein [Cupriavidus sp. TKC]GMG90668.1 hypothetical protein Cmtc_18880 [Cupriavidus sp. TKC]
MPKIYVKKAFTLHHKDEKHEFPVGNHSVSAEVAEHWYVKAHTGEEPAAGNDGDADLADRRAELESEAKMLTDVAAKLNEDRLTLDARAAELVEREKAADQRETELNARAEALDAREVTIAEREKAADAAAKTGKK